MAKEQSLTPRALLFEYPLPCGGQTKISVHGVWSEDDCKILDEFFPLITKAMRGRISAFDAGEPSADV